jgi:hypothetical protein
MKLPHIDRFPVRGVFTLPVTRPAIRFALLVLVLLLPSLCDAQLVTGRFITSMYSWERFDTVGSSRVLTRGVESLLLDVTEGNLSFRTYVTGALNLGEKFGGDGRVRFSNLLLRWRNISDVADVTVGRIPVFAGVGTGVLDGGMIRAHAFDDRMTVVGYGGANVRSNLVSRAADGIANDFFIGGQVIGVLLPEARVSVSYANRRYQQDEYFATRPDSLFNPIRVLVQPEARRQELLGADVRGEVLSTVTLYGRYDYDRKAERTVRAQINSRFAVTKCLTLTGDATYREPRVLFNSFFAVFPTSPIREFEGGAEYSFALPLWVYARGAYLRYNDAVSRRLTIGVNTEYGSLMFLGTNGYAGELSSIDAQLMYPLFERKVVPTLGVTFGMYNPHTELVGKSNLIALSAGGVVRPWQTLSLNAQVQWLRNPVASNDVRFFGTINFWFSQNLGLFTHNPGQP